MALKRLKKELKDHQRNPPHGIAFGVHDESNFLQWNATILGPEGSLYEGTICFIDITLPREYPFKPPTLCFNPPIFHPNVLPDGTLPCFELLKTQWSPAHTVGSVLLKLRACLEDPAGDNCCSVHHLAATMLRDDPERYRRTAWEWAEGEPMPMPKLTKAAKPCAGAGAAAGAAAGAEKRGEEKEETAAADILLPNLRKGLSDAGKELLKGALCDE